MKISSLILTLLLASFAYGQQVIDGLNTKEDIEKFVLEQNPDFREFSLADFQRMPNRDGRVLADSLDLKTWIKTDFNKDGRTDLLVLGIVRRYLVLAIIAEKKGFRVERLAPGVVTNCILPEIKKVDDKDAVVYHYANSVYDQKLRKRTSKFVTDTLVYQGGGFIEYNPSPKSYKITQLEYKTSPCPAGCEVVEMKIEADGKAQYTNWTQKGKEYVGVIDEISLSEILDLVNYVDFPALNKKYDNGSSNESTCTTLINYGEDQTHRVTDSGQSGTHGLRLLYKYFQDLLETQDWTEVPK